MLQLLTERIHRRRKLVLAAVVVLLAVGPYAISRVRSHGRRIRVQSHAQFVKQSTSNRTAIRVITFNIAHGRGNTDDNWQEAGDKKPVRIAEIAALIKSLDADVVVLNEVDFNSSWSGHQNQAEAIARIAEFPYWIEQRNLDFRFIYGSWKFGNAILSKFPIADSRLIEFTAYRSWESVLAGNKRGVVCTLNVSEGLQVQVAAIHLEHRTESVRAASAQMIVDLAKRSKVPLVAVGDFNSTPAKFPESETTINGHNAFEVLAESNYFQSRPTTMPTVDDMTYPSSNPTRVIDWIMIPQTWRFTDYQVIKSTLSDHRPIVATFDVGG